MQSLKQSDELAASVARLDRGDHLARMQVQGRQDRQGPVAHVFMVTNGRVLSRYGWQVRCARAQCLYARLLVDADGVNGHGPGVVNGIIAVQVHVAIDHQHLGHLALELGVALVQVVANSMGFEFVTLQDAPYRGLARALEPGMSRLARMRSHILGQRREAPKLRSQAQIPGFATGQIDHPRFGSLADLRRMRSPEATPLAKALSMHL